MRFTQKVFVSIDNEGINIKVFWNPTRGFQFANHINLFKKTHWRGLFRWSHIYINVDESSLTHWSVCRIFSGNQSHTQINGTQFVLGFYGDRW